MKHVSHRLALVLAASLGAAGCTQHSDQGSTSTVNQGVAAASSPSTTPSGHHSNRFHPHGGLVGIFFRMAEKLDLTPAQQAAVAQAELAVQVDAGPQRAAGEALRADLAAGIRAGALDTAKIANDDEELQAAIAAEKTAQATALDGLHDALDPAKRKALADDVGARLAERDARRPPMLADAGPIDWAKRRLDRLTSQLDLDPAQQKQVAALLAKGAADAGAHESARLAGKARVDALLTAFAGDVFDAHTFSGPADAGREGRDKLPHEEAFLAKLLPILTPEQREKLATTTARPGMSPWRDAHEMPGPDEGDWDNPDGVH